MQQVLEVAQPAQLHVVDALLDAVELQAVVLLVKQRGVETSGESGHISAGTISVTSIKVSEHSLVPFSQLDDVIHDVGQLLRGGAVVLVQLLVDLEREQLHSAEGGVIVDLVDILI